MSKGSGGSGAGGHISGMSLAEAEARVRLRGGGGTVQSSSNARIAGMNKAQRMDAARIAVNQALLGEGRHSHIVSNIASDFDLSHDDVRWIIDHR